jgi:excisionase family DNA binding protein
VPFASNVDPLLTVEDVAHRLSLRPQAVYSLVERRKIACFRIGRRIRFDESQIADFLARSRVEGEGR